MESGVTHDIGQVCMGLHVRRAARRVTRVYDEALAPLELTIGQFSLLTILAGQDRWGMQPLADTLGTDRSSLTATLKPLERRGLVASQADALDGRVRHLVLTPVGSSLLEQAKPLWAEAQKRLLALIGDDDAAAVRSALARLT